MGEVRKQTVTFSLINIANNLVEYHKNKELKTDWSEIGDVNQCEINGLTGTRQTFAHCLPYY